MMQEGYVVINSVPTHIYTYGKWIEEKFDEDTKEIVLIISGNPGLPGFYTTFASTLYDEFQKRVPVWVIGQAGEFETLSFVRCIPRFMIRFKATTSRRGK